MAALESELSDAPQILAWAKRLMTLKAVKTSVSPAFSDEFITYFAERGSVIAKALRDDRKLALVDA